MGKLMDATKKKDVATVMELVSAGVDPNKAMKMSGRHMNPYSYALMTSIWFEEVSEELLQIVEFLTPYMKDHYFKDLNGNNFNGHIFYSSYFDFMASSEKIGDKDPVIEAMLRGGYPFDKDPNLGRYIGNVSFPLAKKLIEQFGTDDGTSVCSAVKSGNLELLCYLLDSGVSPNQPMYFSSGTQSPALVTAIMRNNIEMVKELLKAGADPKLKDTGYNEDAFEMAKGDKDIIALLEAHK
jgi:ankyrin repeat protein